MPQLFALTIALCLALVTGLVPAAAAAQSAPIAFGAVKADPGQPVEVTADNLAVNQADGSAEFTGNVLIVQGPMRLSAESVLVIYKTDAAGKRRIDRLEADGSVVLVNGPDAAEAERAEYSIDDGTVVMTGDVLLSQAGSTITSSRMEVNLTTGTAQMAGRVRTTLTPDGGN